MNKNCAKLSRDLKLLQSSCNGGRGLNCVETMIMYLDANDFHHAQIVAFNEFDKISKYADLSKYIERSFDLTVGR